jgi:hypothetical protein
MPIRLRARSTGDQDRQGTPHTLCRAVKDPPTWTAGLGLSYPLEDGPVSCDGPNFMPAQEYGRTKRPTYDYYESPGWYIQQWSSIAKAVNEAARCDDLHRIMTGLLSLNEALTTLIEDVRADYMDEKCLKTAQQVQAIINDIDVTAQIFPRFFSSWHPIRDALYCIREQFLQSHYAKNRAEIALLSRGSPPPYMAREDSFEREGSSRYQHSVA